MNSPSYCPLSKNLLLLLTSQSAKDLIYSIFNTEVRRLNSYIRLKKLHSSLKMWTPASTLWRRRTAVNISANTHLEFLSELLVPVILLWDGNIVVLALLLAQQLIPWRKSRERPLLAFPTHRTCRRGPVADGDASFNCSPQEKLNQWHWVKMPRYQPQTGDFISSETPKDRAPMKSFLVVRSQSHTSTDSRRSLSVAFSLLHDTRTTRIRFHSPSWVFLLEICSNTSRGVIKW